jgi:hypothetical protein
MRKIYFIVILFLCINCFSQNKQILYNFTSVPQSLRLNPGSDVGYQWYFGVPLFSGVSVNSGSSGFSVHDLFAKDGVDINEKVRKVVAASSSKDRVAFNEQIELFSGGFKVPGFKNDGYISFGMYQESDFLLYMPKDIAILALEGNKDYLGKVFNFANLNLKAESLSVFHYGYHESVNENLILGVTAKLYSSIYNVSSVRNSGRFYTIPTADNTVYKQVVSADLELNTSGLAKYDDDDYDKDNVTKDAVKKAFLGGNLGFGFDAGVTYYPQENIQITASILDLGFIRHTKEVESLSLKGKFENIGIQPDFGSGKKIGNILNDFTRAMPFDTLYKSYTSSRPLKLNSSVQYSFDEDRDGVCNCVADQGRTTYLNALGVQLFVLPNTQVPFAALTTYYRRKIANSLHMKATYTLDSFSYKNVGLGLSGTYGLVNFYVMADNLLEYADVSKANALSFQVGLNIISQ